MDSCIFICVLDLPRSKVVSPPPVSIPESISIFEHHTLVTSNLVSLLKAMEWYYELVVQSRDCFSVSLNKQSYKDIVAVSCIPTLACYPDCLLTRVNFGVLIYGVWGGDIQSFWVTCWAPRIEFFLLMVAKNIALIPEKRKALQQTTTLLFGSINALPLFLTPSWIWLRNSL